MVPTCYPRYHNTDRISVFELTSTTGKVAWTDYIPCAVKAAPVTTNRLRTNDLGYLPFQIIADVTGLKEWIDYIPIDTVAYVAGNQWRVNAAGFIPYVDETA